MSDIDFIPTDHYWQAEDGRVYSSARLAQIEADDAEFLAWIERGGVPSAWPRDAEGAQTEAEIVRTLTFYGLGASPTPAAPVITYKLDFWRRMTEAEADAVEMALAGAPVRDRRMIEEAQVLDHADADFARLREAVVGMFGQARADALLAPSTAA